MGKFTSLDFGTNFEALLNWLDPDRERAGEMYETIRQQLIKMFIWRQCNNPDELADETIDRVVRRVPEIRPGYAGDPRHYFFAVAKNVLLEDRRRPRNPSLGEIDLKFQAETEENSEQLYECLDICMHKLPPDRKALLLAYYEGSKQAKIDRRRELAARFDLRPTAMRMVVYRTRNNLEACIQKCLKDQSERHGGSRVESK